MVYAVLFKLLPHSIRRKCPSERGSPMPSYAAFHGHAVGHSIIISFQPDIYHHSQATNPMPVLFLQVISLVYDIIEPIITLNPQIAFRICLNQSSTTTSGKSSSRFGSLKSRLLNSPLHTQIMAGHATDVKVEVGTTTH